MPDPWTVTASRTVLKDRWIDVRADDCRTASGTGVAPYYVLRYPDFVHVAAITSRHELVLVELYRHAAGRTMLELPGGMMDPADPGPTDAATRELLEETGYAATAWHHVSSLWVNPATHTNQVHCLLATGCEWQEPSVHDAGEDGMVTHLVPLAELEARLAAGLLPQSMQMAGLLLALRHPHFPRR